MTSLSFIALLKQVGTFPYGMQKFVSLLLNICKCTESQLCKSAHGLYAGMWISFDIHIYSHTPFSQSSRTT